LILGSFNGQLCLADWCYRKLRPSIDKRIKVGLDAEFIEEGSDIIEKTKEQLNEYFNCRRTQFELSLLLIGTEFQKDVWNALQQIPYGKRETYLGLSKKLGKVNAIRAVASANGANAISIIVPCHRVIGSNGNLVGYAGGINVKKRLLDIESKKTKNQLVLF